MFIVDRFLGLVNGSPELVKIFIDRIQQLFYYSFIKIIETLLKNKLTSMPVYPVFIRLFLGKYRDDLLNLLRDCLVTIIRGRKLPLLVLLQKKYLYTCKNIVMKPNLEEFLRKLFEQYRIENCGKQLRNGKRAACNHGVMDARGRLLSTKEA